MRLLFLFLSLSGCILPIAAAAQYYNFEHINYTNGLSNNHILSITQDHNGFIWVGTTAGINRFDGYHCKVFKVEENRNAGMADNTISALTTDPIGRIWVRLPNRMVLFNPVTETFSYDQAIQLADRKVELFSVTIAKVLNDSAMLLYVPDLGLINHNLFTNQNVLYEAIPKDEKSLYSNEIINFLPLKDQVVVLFADGTIDYFHPATQEVRRRSKVLQSTEENPYYNLYCDDQGLLWVSSRSFGIVCLRDGEIVKRFNEQTSPALNSNVVTEVVQDKEGNYWIGTDHGGLNILSADAKSIDYVQEERWNEKSLSQNVITAMYKSTEGIIWIGTFKKGVNYYHKKLFSFELFDNKPVGNSLPYNDVNCFEEDSAGNLWIGTNGQGLVYFDRKKGLFQTFERNQELQSLVIVDLCMDASETLWIGTYLGGLVSYDGGELKHYKHIENNPKSLSDNSVWEIFEDSHQNLWVGTLAGGLDLFDRKSGVFAHYSGEGAGTIQSDFVMDITEDEDGDIWFGTDFGVYRYDWESSRFTHYQYDGENKKSLSNNFVYKVFVDSKNKVWVGSRNGLNLFDREQDQFIRLSEKGGLSHQGIMSILESDNGNLWVSTSNGLTKVTVNYNADGTYKAHYGLSFNEMNGLQGREFNEGSAFKTRQGELLFGGANGFNLFYPEESDTVPKIPKTYIVDIEFPGYNGSVKDSLKKKSTLTNQAIHLSYKKNIFTLHFVALDYLASTKIQYRYMLEGFSNQWIYPDVPDRKATFTNLNQGSYTFKVQASLDNKNWEMAERSVEIKISPPWYRSWQAYVVYYIMLFFIIYFLRKSIIKRERSKFLSEEALKESKRQQELNRLKTQFFTNVSHEFRTPISLILTPLGKLLKTDLSPEIRAHLELMNQNAKRLLVLVNQLLDFRKAEEDRHKLNLIYGNIMGFMDQIIRSFDDFRESKHISLEFLPDESSLFMQFDKDKVEKILLNLLSNAFKFTPDGGSIKVQTYTKMQEGKEMLQIEVIDTGIGISAEDQGKIFERFYQTELPEQYITRGSGIGLALASDFARIHGGSIQVESTLGEGSTFMVSLPVNREKLENHAEDADHPDLPTKSGTVLNNKEVAMDSHDTLLIVDDNPDFRFYLRDALQAKFQVVEASDGEEALHLVQDKHPSLVVSDVMMPKMDGYALCKAIKTRTELSHIPVILLTAKSSQQDKLEGLNHGADDYIAKPFNYDILEARINYLIEQRHKFKNEYQRTLRVQPDQVGITDLDRKLLENMNQLIQDNISNAELSVEWLSRELCMSRVYLYKKISSLTGKTPVELVRLIRLRKAYELLQSSGLNISEVAYQVGYSDPKYFSKQFKQEYGELPSKFKDKRAGN